MSITCREMGLYQGVNLCPNCKTAFYFRTFKLVPLQGTFVEIVGILREQKGLTKFDTSNIEEAKSLRESGYLNYENSKMNYRAWNHRCWLVSYMSNSQEMTSPTQQDGQSNRASCDSIEMGEYVVECLTSFRERRDKVCIYKTKDVPKISRKPRVVGWCGLCGC